MPYGEHLLLPLNLNVTSFQFPEDEVYMKDEKRREEYVLNDHGAVFWGGRRGKPWYFGQVSWLFYVDIYPMFHKRFPKMLQLPRLRWVWRFLDVPLQDAFRLSRMPWMKKLPYCKNVKIFVVMKLHDYQTLSQIQLNTSLI